MFTTGSKLLIGSSVVAIVATVLYGVTQEGMLGTIGLASASIALGVWLDIGALMVGVFVIPTTLYFHRYWSFDEPGQRQTQETAFYRNVEILGASLVMFGLFASVGHALPFTLTGPLVTW